MKRSYFIMIFLFSNIITLAFSIYGDRTNQQIDKIKQHIDKIEEADRLENFEIVFNEIDKLKKIPRQSVIEYLKFEIENSKYSWDKAKAVAYAGILGLEEMRDYISQLNFYTEDICIEVSKYFYFYKIGLEKENQIKYLKYFAEVDMGQDIPQILFAPKNYSIDFLGWIFEKRVLCFLESIRNLDAGIAEDCFRSISRIKFKLEEESS